MPVDIGEALQRVEHTKALALWIARLQPPAWLSPADAVSAVPEARSVQILASRIQRRICQRQRFPLSRSRRLRRRLTGRLSDKRQRRQRNFSGTGECIDPVVLVQLQAQLGVG